MKTKVCLGHGFLVPYSFAPFLVRSLFSEQLLSLFNTIVSGSGFRTSVLFIRIIVPKCCGSWMFIPDPKFFHSRIRIFSIPDPHPLSLKKFSILTQNNGTMVYKLSEICFGFFIADPDPDFLPIHDLVVKKAPNPGSATQMSPSGSRSYMVINVCCQIMINFVRIKILNTI